VYTDDGPVVFDGEEADKDTGAGEALTRAFARAVETGEPPLVDVHRGLHLQRLIAEVGGQLAS
jgi:predicted dehydrogenase